MASRVRMCILSGFVVAGVAMSGGLVACSDTGTSGKSTKVSRSATASSDSSDYAVNVGDEIDADLVAKSLNGKKNDDDQHMPIVKITGTIKNKTGQDITIDTLSEDFYFDCQFRKIDIERSKNATWRDPWDPEDMCGDEKSTTVTIPSHGTYKANDGKGIFYDDGSLFDDTSWKDSSKIRPGDFYRKKDGRKEFLMDISRQQHSGEKGYQKSAEVWVTMKGV